MDAFEPFCVERQKALDKLKPKENCPGEKVCTTDPIQGFIAGAAGATLATHCNPQRCRLYYTKSDESVTPVEFVAAFHAAVELRELEIDGYTLTTEGFAFWRVEAHKALMRAIRTAEYERDEPDQPAQVPGDSTAFRFDLLEGQEGSKA